MARQAFATDRHRPRRFSRLSVGAGAAAARSRAPMRDLRILFTPADPGYRAHLADAEGNRLGVEVPFTPFLEESDYDDLRWYLEEYMDLPDGGAVVRAQRIEGNLDRWGQKLHDDLFTAPENCALLKELLSGPEPRELTLATRDPELLRWPWELMADDAGSLAEPAP